MQQVALEKAIKFDSEILENFYQTNKTSVITRYHLYIFSDLIIDG